MFMWLCWVAPRSGIQARQDFHAGAWDRRVMIPPLHTAAAPRIGLAIP
jgi:hypothetical protein